MALITSVFSSGPDSAKPAASSSNNGYFYCSTDLNGGTLYQSTGSSWLQLASPVSPQTVSASGLTGATAVSRYVGATTSGAPATGSFLVGDFVVDRTGKIWVCTAAGSPGTWATGTGGGGGTVTSVGLSLPAEFTVTGSPVTASGTLTATKVSQSANTVYAGPSSGTATAPTFRSIAQTDLPTFTGDAGSGGAKGAVPAPAAGDASAGKYLKADGTWTVPPTGSGGSGGMSVYNVKATYGAVGDGTTNDATAIQNAITAAQNAGGGVVYFPKGTYHVTSNISYSLNTHPDAGVLTFVGDGMNNSTVNFDGANLSDGAYANWNTGYTELHVRDLAFLFNGNGTAGKWVAPTTLPYLTNVRLKITGTYAAGAYVILGDGGSGPVGQTCTWKDVVYEPGWGTGDNVYGLTLHYDSFRWIGGGITTGFGASTPVLPRVIFVQNVYDATFEDLNEFTGATETAKAFCYINQSENTGLVTFRRCGWINSSWTYIVYANHSPNGTTNPVRVLFDNCRMSTIAWPPPSGVAASQGIAIYYANNQQYVVDNHGATSVASAGTVSHGLGGTPTAVTASSSVADHKVSITAKSSTTFTVSITDHTGASIGTAETIYWHAVI